MPGNGSVLPFDLRCLARFDIDRALLGVGDVALVFQLPQVVPARSQALKPDIAPIIGGLLVDRGVATIIEDEGHTGDALAVRCGHLVDEDAGDGVVFHDDRFAFSVLHREIVGRVVQLEALRTLRLHGIVAAILQSDKDTAGGPGGHGVHQSVIRHPADLKGYAGKPLGLVRGTDLDDLHATHGCIIKVEVLGIVRVDHHRLALCVGINRVSRDALHLGHDHCASDTGEDDLPLGIGPVQAIGGQLATLVREVGAICVDDFELNPCQRSLFVGTGQLVNNQIAQGLVAELQSDGLSRLDGSRLGHIVQQVARLGPRLLDHQRGAGVDALN